MARALFIMMIKVDIMANFRMGRGMAMGSVLVVMLVLLGVIRIKRSMVTLRFALFSALFQNQLFFFKIYIRLILIKGVVIEESEYKNGEKDGKTKILGKGWIFSG